MKSQNNVQDQRSLTPLDHLIGIFIMVMESIFFISAPMLGMILVAMALTVILSLSTLGSPRGSGDTTFLHIFLVTCLGTPPLGILLGFYIFKKVNQKTALGRKQKNLALAIKSGTGFAGLVFITSLIFTIRSHYYYFGIAMIVCIASLIPSAFVCWFVYRYLNRLNT